MTYARVAATLLIIIAAHCAKLWVGTRLPQWWPALAGVTLQPLDVQAQNRRGFWDFASASVGLMIAAWVSDTSMLWTILRLHSLQGRFAIGTLVMLPYILVFALALCLRWLVAENLDRQPDQRFARFLCSWFGWTIGVILFYAGAFFALAIPG